MASAFEDELEETILGRLDALCVRWDQVQDRLVLSLRFRWRCSMTSFGSLIETARVGLHLYGHGIWDPHASLVRVDGTPSYFGLRSRWKLLRDAPQLVRVMIYVIAHLWTSAFVD